jgi:hypothetical protein
MINVGYGVFNTAGGGGGFTPAYYTPDSYLPIVWANPENAYDGTGVATGANTGTTVNPNNGAFESASTQVAQTYNFGSVTGFSQIQINGDYGYELTSAATQYTTGSEDPFFQGYVTGTAQFSVQVSTDNGSTWTTIELRNKNTVGNPPVGGTDSGSDTFTSTINSGSVIALPANLNLLKIRLISAISANGYRNSDGVLYEATGLSENNVSNMTVYVS